MSDLALSNALDGVIGSLGATVGEVPGILDTAGQGVGGIVGDLGGLLPPQGPFQECIVAALRGDSSLYAFPQDILQEITNNHPYNLDYPWTPAAIVYPRNTIDVSKVVVCASTYGIAVQPKSGGHSYCNFGYGGQDGSLAVDLQHMDDFNYNPADQTVTFGPGNKLADLDRHLAAIDRVMAYGVVGDIGTGGQIAIGGLGPLSRLLGLASDQVISVECVLGDGSIVRASAYENPDLFFAIRGAAWSFCIMTEIQMQTSPSPSAAIEFQYNITVGRYADLAGTFKKWQQLIADPSLSRHFAATLTLTAPGLMIFAGTFYGTEPEFNQLNLDFVLPFGQEELGITVVSRIATGLIHSLTDFLYDVGGTIPAHFYSNSLKYTRRTLLSDAAVDQLFQYFDSAPTDSLIWFVVWDLNGGFIEEIPQTATAYWHRDALHFQQAYVVSPFGPVSAASHEFLVGLNRLCRQLNPGIDESAYAGYVDAALLDPLTAYWGGNVARLIQIKGVYDPWNTFRNPQSIPPPARA
ncbi:Putative oxygen oxidoreductase covalent FAD-binding, berberine/berberine [Septoria linicola]|uniref:Oxygen oxidoreductase covalent FAD-binding, berberine/berberine n=1 Tax=Septoria linicola TaxID=215465 RepID=A0A9Q9B1U7_9PEZI|nr:putative oxygen oxidoreductase covalent FAD-binding, berberine/berberine [Septoria linicola]USW59419.1 Putative oxygen oxidoreductase covalent FAD-binding, berberine/berberine [Septoria linicola]